MTATRIALMFLFSGRGCVRFSLVPGRVRGGVAFATPLPWPEIAGRTGPPVDIVALPSVGQPLPFGAFAQELGRRGEPVIVTRHGTLC